MGNTGVIMNIKVTTLITILSAITLLMACQSTNKLNNPFKEPKAIVMCKVPRPEACTKEYLPVCAQKDTGIRCVTTPCPSSEDVTYSNACTACADPKVFSHKAGACN